MDLLSSAVATGCAEILTLPICTIKTNYQNSSSTNIGRTIRMMYAQGGARVFFQASVPAISSQIFSTSSKYFLYRGLEHKFNPTNNPYKRVLHGVTSGLVSTILTHPLDFVKVHWQMSPAQSTQRATVSCIGVIARRFQKFWYRPLCFFHSMNICARIMACQPIGLLVSQLLFRQQLCNHWTMQRHDRFMACRIILVGTC